MLNDHDLGQKTSDTLRELTIDELESVYGGATPTTLPPGDCGANCHKCGCGCP
ncbi:MAG: bacteriocin [Xanthobacteraceae bacterium]